MLNDNCILCKKKQSEQNQWRETKIDNLEAGWLRTPKGYVCPDCVENRFDEIEKAFA